jgi:hypothetical protein
MRQSGFSSPTLSSLKCRDTHSCGVAQTLRCCRCIVRILDRINATGIAVYIHLEAIAHTKTHWQSRLRQSDKDKTVAVLSLGAVIAVMVAAAAAAKVLRGRCLSVP